MKISKGVHIALRKQKSTEDPHGPTTLLKLSMIWPSHLSSSQGSCFGESHSKAAINTVAKDASYSLKVQTPPEKGFNPLKPL